MLFFLMVAFSKLSSLPLETLANFQSQSQDSPLRCGAYCLYIALKSFDKAPDGFDRFEEVVGVPTSAGYSLQMLKDAAVSSGLDAICVRTTPELLKMRREPFACIAHLNGNHFVLLAGFEGDDAIVIDPPRDYRMPVKTLKERWSGDSLLMAVQRLEPEESLSRRLWFRRMLERAVWSLGVIAVLGFSYRQLRKYKRAE